MTTLRSQLESRLQELHKELADGEKMIADLQARQSQIRETLLRISGAVQVLEEVLQGADEVEDAPTAPRQEAPELAAASLPEPPPAPEAAPAPAPVVEPAPVLIQEPVATPATAPAPAADAAEPPPAPAPAAWP